MAISADEPDESENFARQGRIPFPLLHDEGVRVADSYGVAMLDVEVAIPSTFIITTSGHIHWKTVGETMADRADMDEVLALLDALLAG